MRRDLSPNYARSSIPLPGVVWTLECGDSTRLVHVQEDRLDSLRSSDNHNIFIYTHAFHTTLINIFINTRFEPISIRMLSPT